ncbi:hypothetical protein OSTOST_23005 [Ostertagia ostertagi]
MCSDPRFATIANAMRVEQCAAIAYSIDATTYVAFPSSQFSSLFGLPWLQYPSLHVLVIHANPLFYADSSDVNSFSDETEITNKIPLGTAILDGDDIAISNFCNSQDHPKTQQFIQPEPRAPVANLPFIESPSQESTNSHEASQSTYVDTESEEPVPLPPVPLPQFAGKKCLGCLRNKPPQVFVEQPPLIGKSVPPPAPGAARTNENKCGKKLSNDRDEAVKAGLHGRLPPKDLLTRKQPLPAVDRAVQGPQSNSPIPEVNPSPSTVVNKHKDLFQGVFTTIAKGGSADVDKADNGVEPIPLAEPAPEAAKAVDFIDDHDEDYDAQFMCETTASMDSQVSSCPSSASTTFGMVLASFPVEIIAVVSAK